MDMAEHYVFAAADNFDMTIENNPIFLNCLPSEFGATKDYWEDKDIPSGHLLNATYTCQATENQVQFHQTMKVVSVDTRSDEFQSMFQNSIANPPLKNPGSPK